MQIYKFISTARRIITEKIEVSVLASEESEANEIANEILYKYPDIPIDLGRQVITYYVGDRNYDACDILNQECVEPGGTR